MTDDEVFRFLHEERTVVMSTIDPRGDIHSVAMWYAVLNGHICVTTKAKSMKVKNLERDRRITCLVEAGSTYEQLRGASITGDGEIVSDDARTIAVTRALMARHGRPDPSDDEVSAAIQNRVTLEVHPRRVVTWDHRKLKA